MMMRIVATVAVAPQTEHRYTPCSGTTCHGNDRSEGRESDDGPILADFLFGFDIVQRERE